MLESEFRDILVTQVDLTRILVRIKMMKKKNIHYILLVPVPIMVDKHKDQIKQTFLLI